MHRWFRLLLITVWACAGCGDGGDSTSWGPPRSEGTAISPGTIADILAGGVSIPPIVVKDAMFRRVRSQVRIRNTAATSMSFSGRFTAAEGLTVNPGAISRIIAPNSFVLVDFELIASEPVASGRIGPVGLSWKAQLSSAAVAEGETSIRIDGMHDCPPRRTAVILDGRLDEWPDLPHGHDQPAYAERANWTGPDDGSYRFAAAWDQKYVYVAVRVLDDQVRPDADGLTLWLDMRSRIPRAMRHIGRRSSAVMVIDLAPGAATDDLPDGVRVLSATTPTGYTVEFAIPVRYLDAHQYDWWEGFRINIGLRDRDDGPGVTHLWWRPQWVSQKAYVGSGSFERRMPEGEDSPMRLRRGAVGDRI